MSTKLGTLTLDLIAKIGSFTEPMKKAGDTAQRETKRIESSVSSASKAIAGLGAAALAGLTVGSVINMADEYTQMAARIRNATADTAEYDMVQKRLLETANGTYRSLSEAQEVYLGLSGGLKELGYNTQQILDISDSLSYSFVHNATSADKAKSAMSAYGKVLDKGKVEADSWFSIMAATPNILDDVAKATGKLPSEIRKLGAEGKLAAEDLNKGFLQSLGANKALADAMENSLADGMFALKNGFSVLVGEANMATGATSTLAAGLATVGDVLVLASENLDVIAVAGGTAATVLALKMTPAIILSGKSFAISSIESVKYQVALARMAAQAGGTTTALTLLGGAARGALAVLGGPIGLALTVATVAASYLLMRDNTDKSTESLRANNQTVADAVQKYKELGEVKQREQLVVEKEQLAALNDEYDNAATKLITYSLKVARHSDMTREQAREVSALTLQYKSGAITLEDFSRSINSNKNITQQAKNEFNLFAGSVKTAGDEAGKQNSLIAQLESTLYGVANGGDAAAGGIRNATNALSEFAEKARQAGVVAKATNTLIAKGYNPKVAADLAELAVKNGQVSREEAAAILFKNREQEKLNKTVEAYNKTHATSAVRSRTRTAAAREETKALRDQNRALEEQQRNREQISKAYASDFQNMVWNEKEQQDLVKGSGFSATEQTKYLALVQKRFNAESAEYFKALNLELNQYKWSEERKLEYAYQMDREIAENDVKIADEVRVAKLKFLDEQYAIERKMLQINQSKQLLEAKRHWMTAGDYAKEYYALVREEILNTAEYSPEMKQSLVKEANFNQGLESNAEREQVWGDYKSMMGLDKSPYQQDMDLLAEARAQMLITEEEYQNARLQLQAKSTASYMVGMLGGFASLVDENSKTYAVLFAAQKAFAVAQAMLNIPAAYSKAYDAVVGTPYIGPYIAPAVGAAAAALQVAQAASMRSVNITGMAHNGIDNIPKEGTWLLDKGERVVDSRTNSDLKDFIANGGNGPQININVPPGYTAEQSRGADGAVTIDIVEKRIKQSWSNLGNPNSYESKQVQRNTTAGVKR